MILGTKKVLAAIVGFILKSKGAKVGAGAVGGSGIIALVVGLHADIKSEIEKQDIAHKEYVQLVLSPVQVEIRNLQKDQTETKVMVRDIHNYLLKKK